MLPSGFLFRPSDEELLVAYLKNKLLQWPVPCDIILEADVYGSRPEDLTLEYPMANRDFEWFFFTSTTRKHPGASETSRASRRAGLGRWKATKGIKTVVDSRNYTIGSKQSFCYIEQNSNGGEEKSVWLMEEFSIQNLRRRGSAGVTSDTNKLDDWVICKIYLTPKSRKAYAEDHKPINIATLEPAAKRRRIEPADMTVPPGFIFQPTDEELLDSFLKEKLLHQPLPCDIIQEADVYGNHPSNLIAQFPMANRNSEWFFFTWTTRKHPDAEACSRASRVAGQGRWKSTQSVKPVLNHEGQVIGSKQNFGYMERTLSEKEEKSIWLMEEYSIQDLRRRGGANKLDDWVVSKIYLRPCARKELFGTKVPATESGMLEVQEIGNQPFIFPSQDSLTSQLAGNTFPQLTEASDREMESSTEVPTMESGMLEMPEIWNQPIIFPSQDSLISQLAGNTLPQLTEASDREVEYSTEIPTMLEVPEIWYQPLIFPSQDSLTSQLAGNTLLQLTEASDQEVEYSTEVPTMLEVPEIWNQPLIFPSQDSLTSQLAGNTLLQLNEASDREMESTTEVPTMESGMLEVPETWNQPLIFPSQDSLTSQLAGNTLLQLTEASDREMESTTEVPTMESGMLEVPETWNQPLIFPSQDSPISQLAANTLPQLTKASDREVEPCTSTLHDSPLLYPTPDELDEIFETLPIDQIVLQLCSAPDGSPWC